MATHVAAEMSEPTDRIRSAEAPPPWSELSLRLCLILAPLRLLLPALLPAYQAGDAGCGLTEVQVWCSGFPASGFAAFLLNLPFLVFFDGPLVLYGDLVSGRLLEPVFLLSLTTLMAAGATLVLILAIHGAWRRIASMRQRDR